LIKPLANGAAVELGDDELVTGRQLVRRTRHRVNYSGGDANERDTGNKPTLPLTLIITATFAALRLLRIRCAYIV